MIDEVINELNQRADNNRAMARYLRGLKQKDFMEARKTRAATLEKEASQLDDCVRRLRG